MTNILELEYPHGFLVWSGKQSAIPSSEQLETDKPLTLVSDGEAFGTIILEEPAELSVSEFGRKEWSSQHLIYPRERRQFWPEASKLYVYRIASFEPYEETKLYENGAIVDKPELTVNQEEIVFKSKQLPKQFLLSEDAVSLTEDYKFHFHPLVNLNSELTDILKATYQRNIDIDTNESDNIHIPVYALALVRSRKMLPVLKKNKQVDDMPWKIEKRDDQFCVIKESNDEIEGCHDTRDDAQAQLAALNISEEDKELVENDKTVISVGSNIGISNKTPDIKIDINDTTPSYNEENEKTTLVSKIKAAMTSLKDLLTFAETGQKDNAELFNTELFTTDTGIAVKTVHGEPWHFTWTTNAFKDREQEIFSTKSLENYVLQSEKQDDRGFFNLWHINEEDGNFNSDFAVKKWQGITGRFLVEAGPYLEDEKGQAARKFFSEFTDEHPDIAPEGWGCSPEYKYLPEERATGVYDNIWITRTSTLPKLAAANIWTQTKQVSNMLTDSQKQAAVALFGEDYVSKNIVDEGEKRTLELENAEVDHKDVKLEDKEKKSQEIELDIEALAAEVAKQFKTDFTPLAESIAIIADGLKSVQEKIVQLEESKEIKQVTETPRFVLNMKRASEADETVVDDNNSLKDKRPVEIAPAKGQDSFDTFFGAQ